MGARPGLEPQKGNTMDDLSLYASLFVSRWSDFARQRESGAYWRVGRPLTRQDLEQHLRGRWTLGTYVIDEQGQCPFAVFDADTDDGLDVLRQIQVQLAQQTIPSSLERSRRGGHLWVFLAHPVLASRVRAWLLPFCPDGVEFYPKQAEGSGYGSLIRLPLGVHRRSGKRYPFISWSNAGLTPAARSVSETLAWLATISRVEVPPMEPALLITHTAQRSFSSARHASPVSRSMTIRNWCAQQDPLQVIGAYVDLNAQGIGRCPFAWHHAQGDTHSSFKVYAPGSPGGYCWYCYTWQQGGSVFDFLRYYHGLDAREMWKRIQEQSTITSMTNNHQSSCSEQTRKSPF